MSSPSCARPGLVWLVGMSALAALILGQGCPPLGTGPGDSGQPGGTGLTVVVRSPGLNQTISPGETVTMVYDAIGSGVSVAAFYDSDGVDRSGDEITFASGLAGGSNRFAQMPTTNMAPGTYRFGITATTGSARTTVYATGTVTLVGAMAFTNPIRDLTVGPGVQAPLRFNAGLGMNNFSFRIFYDTDGVYNGNEVTVSTGSSTTATVNGHFDTTGLGAGTYYLGARVTAVSGGTSEAYAPGKINIVSGAFVQVLAPTVGLVTSPGTQIQTIVAASDPSSSTSTVRIFYDPDNLVNGNETTIATIPVAGAGAIWDTTPVLPGFYYVGAELENDFSPRLVSYSQGPVTLVTPGSGGIGQPGDGDGSGLPGGAPAIVVTTPLIPSTIFSGKIFRVNWLTNVRTGEGTVTVFREPDFDNNGQPDGPATRIALPPTGIDATTQFVDFDTTGVVGKFFIGATLTPLDSPPVTAYAMGTLTIKPLVFWAGDLSTRKTPSGTVIPQTGAFQGAVFRGFNFHDNLGSAMIAADDYDDDRRNEIVLVAQFGKPFLYAQQGRGAGEAYMIYGRPQRYSGDYDVNMTGTSLTPGTIFTGIMPNPLPASNPLPEAKAGTSDPYAVDGRLAEPFDSEGLRSLTTIPDQDGDGKRELVFGIPWCNSYSLRYQTQQPNYPPGIGRLENNGHFLRGGVVIVSSRNSLLRNREALSPAHDRALHLQQVGQIFSDMGSNYDGAIHVLLKDHCPCPAGDGLNDTVVLPNEGFIQNTKRTDQPRIDPPRLADPEPAYARSLLYRETIDTDQVDATATEAHGGYWGGRYPDCTFTGAFDLDKDDRQDPVWGDFPSLGYAYIARTGFYQTLPDLGGITACGGAPYNTTSVCGNRAMSDPLEPYGCRILGQTTTQPLLGTTANRFANSVSVSGDYLLIGAPLRTVEKEDVPLLPQADRFESGEVYMLSLKRPGMPANHFLYSTGDLPPHRELPAPYNHIIKDVGYFNCSSQLAVGGPEDALARPFHLVGASPGDHIGEVVGVHDLNNDGVEDVVIGGPGTNAGRGAVYVIYRRIPEIEGDYLLENLQLDPMHLDRLRGMMILGENGENLGTALGGGGPLNDDFNNDGNADFLIGSPNSSPASGYHAGSAFILFGGRDILTPSGGTTLAQLVAQRDGMLLIGARATDAAGTTVANAGDVNGDGIPDILIAAPDATPRFVDNAGIERFGLDLDGNGVRDDLNQNGIVDDSDPEDQMMGAGIVYVVFGGPHLTGTISLSQIGTVHLPGFMIVGRKSGDHLGGGLTQTNLLARGVTSAGDLDADGRADLLIGAILADPDGRTDAGEVYLIYGFRP